MPNTNVKSEWVSGELVFKDSSGNEIFTIDGTNRELSVPSGSTFANAGTAAMTGTQTFDDILGGDASLAVTGQAPQTVTAAGGAIALAGAVGGATSGAGGAVTTVGGVGTAGNSAGGATSTTGGAGQGTAAGGAASVVGGIGGATGDGGAVSITGGSSGGASDTGGAVNIDAGAANGGTIGSVNICSAAGDLLGFHGATAVDQAAAIDSILAMLRASGLIAT